MSETTSRHQVTGSEVRTGDVVIIGDGIRYPVTDVRRTGNGSADVWTVSVDMRGQAGWFVIDTGRTVTVERVSEAPFGTDAWLATVAEPIARTERVRTDELAEGDVIEYSSGARETVVRVGPRMTTGGRFYLWVEVTDAEGERGGSFWGVRSRWDRLTEAEKARLGYPTAEHDVPSVREPRETAAETVHAGGPGLHVI